MRAYRYQVMTLLVGLLWCQAPAVLMAQISRTQAVEAMHRAVDFFRTQFSSGGGYVFRSSADLELREGESRVGSATAWIEPPATPAVGAAYLAAYHLTNDPLLLVAAQETAQALLQGQMISGGWYEHIEFDPQERAKYAYRVDGSDVGQRRNTTTFDDDKTQSAIRFLIRLDRTLRQKNAALHEAVMYALDAVLAAQYPNGAWPQKYEGSIDYSHLTITQASYPTDWPREFPNKKYTEFYTLNDNTVVDLISTLLEAWDVYEDERYFEAAKRGGNFLVLAQMPAPQPGWAQQYDAHMHPAWARKFEPPAITGGESQGVMRMLLTLYRRTGDVRYLEPVRTALPYYQQSLLANGRLARFYELKTNRPLYFTKTYELTYSDSDVPTHYSFSSNSSLDRIGRELAQLENTPPDQLGPVAVIDTPQLTDKLQEETSHIIANLDKRGAWVEPGKLRTYPDAKVEEIITSSTFMRNLATLANCIAAVK